MAVGILLWLSRFSLSLSQFQPIFKYFDSISKQLLEEAFVISRKIKVEVSVISQAEGRG